MDFRSVAVSAAKKAGKIVLSKYGRLDSISYKDARNVVTEADILSEKAIIGKIRKCFPTHAILSEESEFMKGTSDFTWFIDPVDGTTNFSRNIPFFCVSIALAKKEKVILGVVYNPLLNQLFIAEKGKGAFLNGKRISVSKVGVLGDSLLTLSSGTASSALDLRQRSAGRLRHKIFALREFGSAALELCHVACGRTEAAVIIGSHPWDVAAGMLIAKEAGAIVTGFKGEKSMPETKDIILANRKIHGDILKLLR